MLSLSNTAIRRRVLISAISAVALCGGITASVLGQSEVRSDLDPQVVDALKSSDGQDILLILAVDEQGNVASFCGYHDGKPCQPVEYEELPDPIEEIFMYMAVGNPKVCWKTSGGDKECVTYD